MDGPRQGGYDSQPSELDLLRGHYASQDGLPRADASFSSRHADGSDASVPNVSSDSDDRGSERSVPGEETVGSPSIAAPPSTRARKVSSGLLATLDGGEDSIASSGSDPEAPRMTQVQEDAIRQPLLLALKLAGHNHWHEEYNRVPVGRDGKLSSLGSIGHGKNDCRICVFFAIESGCLSGIDCAYCHLRHEEPQRRPCNAKVSQGKRDHYKKLVVRLVLELEENPETFDINNLELPPSIANNEKVKADFLAKLRMHAVQVRQRRERDPNTSVVSPEEVLLTKENLSKATKTTRDRPSARRAERFLASAKAASTRTSM